MGKMGLQLYSVKEAAEKNLLEVIQRVADMGYQGVQFAGFYHNSAGKIKAKMDEVGMKAAGAHVPISELQNQLDETLRYHDTIGNNLIICPYLPEDMRTTEDDYIRTADILNEIGKKLNKLGFDFAYHNHAFEFEQFNGKTEFDILYKNTNPDYLKMELDCYWVIQAGYNPQEIINTYTDRCISLHIKDMKSIGSKKVSTEIGIGF